jgi:hypothetical protein
MPRLIYSASTPASTPNPPQDKLTAAVEELQQHPPKTELDPLVVDLRPLIDYDTLPDIWDFNALKRYRDQRTPWNVDGADKAFFLEYEKPFREYEALRLAYLAAVKAKRDKLNPADPFYPAERRQLDSLIAGIEADRASIWDKDFFGVNHQYKPWALATRDLGRLLLAALQSADRNAGRRPRTEFSGAAINLVYAWLLDGHVNENESPSKAEVARILRKLDTSPKS